ncbi:Anaerobic sulfatase-maturating enzyme [Candidatus Promineifilum breve]|uniref:Anaerobic sulfatase-maturating enzyme n=1 Tax=Candidatus Promineifilum breve TaxID=1806508 RepID=A0A160TAJ8_9CHLR|nr:anaerobic sulfatase-maturation protein [Candidatus Promineifilum breve]CUS06130.1 Anaerobic sulfatase-maturating enzyme [Candidatus Promineifilum breve]
MLTHFPATAPPRFHVLVKPTGATCNLDCAYCFFLSKEMLYPGSRFRMADDLLETYIRQLIESHQTNEVTIAWQGGEPTLMGLPFFRRAVELAEQYRRPGMTIEYTMQTNGTLLNDEWGAFLAANNFLMGISIDGPREFHDHYRYDKGGGPTFDRVMRGLDVLKRHKVEWNVLCTLHRHNADRPLEIYRFFRDELGAQFMQFIPIVERLTAEQAAATANLAEPWRSWRDRPLYVLAGDVVTERSVTAEQYGDFLCAVFDEWVRRDVGRVYVQMFDVALANWVGAPSGLCVHSRTCGIALAVEHNGDLYSCDHFVEPAYRLGNIREDHLIELVASDKQRQFGQDKYDALPGYCRTCEVRFACHGGCPKDRFIHTPDGEPGLNYLCAGYKRFFHHIDEAMQFMGMELSRQRPPANVMAYMARQDAARPRPAAAPAAPAVARNAPCPCGSGKKYKHCHGRAS